MAMRLEGSRSYWAFQRGVERLETTLCHEYPTWPASKGPLPRVISNPSECAPYTTSTTSGLDMVVPFLQWTYGG